MKKYLITGSAVLIVLTALSLAGLAYAQGQNPPTPQPPAAGQTYQNFPFPGLMRGLLNNFRPAQIARGLIARLRPSQAARLGAMAGFRMGANFAGVAGPMHDAVLQALASGLGLSVDDLQAKLNSGQTINDIAKAQGLSDAQIQDLMDQAHEAALKAMVDAGFITQEQADAMEDQHMEDMWQFGGDWMLGAFQGQRMGLGVDGPLHDYRIQAYAEATGLTTTEVETRLNNGETLWQIAESQGMTLEQFRTKLVEAFNHVINQALADGKITQAQADFLTNWVDQINQFGFGPGAGFGGFGPGRMRMMPGMHWNTQP